LACARHLSQERFGREITYDIRDRLSIAKPFLDKLRSAMLNTLKINEIQGALVLRFLAADRLTGLVV
jgi:hypothetical protein